MLISLGFPYSMQRKKNKPLDVQSLNTSLSRSKDSSNEQMKAIILLVYIKKTHNIGLMAHLGCIYTTGLAAQFPFIAFIFIFSMLTSTFQVTHIWYLHLHLLKLCLQ